MRNSGFFAHVDKNRRADTATVSQIRGRIARRPAHLSAADSAESSKHHDDTILHENSGFFHTYVDKENLGADTAIVSEEGNRIARRPVSSLRADSAESSCKHHVDTFLQENSGLRSESEAPEEPLRTAVAEQVGPDG
eukprot:7554450-Karenia_brevis.AAC.1